MIGPLASFLVEIIVQQAFIGVFGSHTITFVRETIVSVSRLAEGVEVANISVPVEQRIALLNGTDFLCCKSYLDIKDQLGIGAREHCEKSFADLLFTLVSIRQKTCIEGHDFSRNVRESDFVCGGLSVISPIERDFEIFKRTKIVNISRHHPDVSAELSFIGFPRVSQLFVGITDLRPQRINLAEGGNEQTGGEDGIDNNASGDNGFPSYSAILAVGWR